MKNRIKQYLLVASMCVGLTACSDFFEPIPGVQFGLTKRLPPSKGRKNI